MIGKVKYTLNHQIYWLKNVKIESGFKWENGQVVETETEIVHLLISHGKIERITKSLEDITNDYLQKEVEGLLLIPSFVEKHVHLDKTYMGGKWQSCIPASSVIERCEIEKNILKSLPTETHVRAERLLKQLLSFGSTHVRTHVDIYPEVGIRNLEEVQAAIQNFSDQMFVEIVAFAQHGLLKKETINYMKQAVKHGAGIVGAVDPATVDNNIEASLVQLMELAVEGNADIDLHLHDPGHLGTFTMKRLAHLTLEAGWQGRVSISHAFGLGGVSLKEARETAELLKEAGISIVTSLPIGKDIPPVDFLDECGIQVAIGNDNIFDSWWPTGNGDILERATRLIERYRWTNEVSLSQILKFITGGITTLDRNGQQQWPKTGDSANFLFIDASCSAEVIARRIKPNGVMYKGNLVYGELNKVEPVND
ncbi:amidohydrolase family protein [Bacillus sp. CRN 9]|nr:amidohydrolase family protein [Bacillus sp. CRN 9]